MRCSTRVTWGS